MQFKGKTDEYYEVVELTSSNQDLIASLKDSRMSVIWFQADDNKIEIA